MIIPCKSKWLIRGCGLDCDGGGIFPGSCINGGDGEVVVVNEITTRLIPHPFCGQYQLLEVLLDGIPRLGWTFQPSSYSATYLGKECPDGYCLVDCASDPNGCCCIPHALTDRLLQQLQNS